MNSGAQVIGLMHNCCRINRSSTCLPQTLPVLLATLVEIVYAFVAERAFALLEILQRLIPNLGQSFVRASRDWRSVGSSVVSYVYLSMQSADFGPATRRHASSVEAQLSS
jgi:hypothetical protein